MTEQEARDDEREALQAEVDRRYPPHPNTHGWSYEDAAHYEGVREGLLEGLAEARKSPDPEITKAVRELAAEGVRFDMNPTMNMRTTNELYVQFAAYLRRIDAAWREAVAALLPVEGQERGCPYCEQVRRMDALYGSNIGVCIKHRTQPVPPAAPDWMPRIGGEPA